MVNMIGWGARTTAIGAAAAAGAVAVDAGGSRLVAAVAAAPALTRYDVTQLSSVRVLPPASVSSLDRRYPSSVLVNFTAFGVALSLILHRTELSTMIRQGATINYKGTTAPLKGIEYFDGHIIGFEDESEFHGSLRDGVLSGMLGFNSTVFHIEAAARFVAGSGPRDMIVYRLEDAALPSDRGHARAVQASEVPVGANHREHNHERSFGSARRRSAGQRQVCSVHLVADSAYLRDYARDDVALALHEMLFHIREANAIFQGTDFDEDGFSEGIGLLVSNVTFIDKVDSYDYSSPNGTVLMDTIRDRYRFTYVCLAMLWTFQSMRDTLGMSFVANRASMAVGVYGRYNHLFVNPAFYGKIALRGMFTVTVSHEIGHAFGAGHDPRERGAPCSPTENAGGVYIMYPVVSSGRMTNNRRFSPCSVKNISDVLTARRLYFYKQLTAYCGNGLVEDGEECDCGTIESCDKIDRCCVPAPSSAEKRRAVRLGPRPCTLRQSPPAACSPRTMPCCTRGCSVVGEDERRACSIPNECTPMAFCDGRAPTCPRPRPLPDNSSCASGSKVCLAGECVGSLCTVAGLEECACQGVDASSGASLECVLCCKRSGAASCLPAEYFSALGKSRIILPAGSYCADGRGYCDAAGLCQSPGADVSFDRGAVIAAAADLFKSQWQYILPCAVTSLILYGIHRLRPEAGVSASRAFRSGRVAKAFYFANAARHSVMRRVVAVDESDGRTRTERIPVEAHLRLAALFPTAPQAVSARLSAYGASEADAVLGLVVAGYPMRRVIGSSTKPLSAVSVTTGGVTTGGAATAVGSAPA